MGSNWKSALSGVRVLLVEDDGDTREVLALGLELSGAEVLSTDTAAAAIAAIGRFRPHVLLSDIGLAGEDGYHLIRRVRSLPPEDGGTLPAAAVTAFTLADDRRRALREGFDAHFSKPVETADLIETVAALARKSRWHGGAPPLPDRRSGERRKNGRDPNDQRRLHERRHDSSAAGP